MQITGLPSTTTVDANSVFALENSGITYKANGNAMANGLQTLMETNSDTGWVNITPLNGLEVVQRFAVRRAGKTVYLVGHQLHLPAASNTGNVTIGTLESRFYPDVRWDIRPALPYTTGAFYISITNNGNIQLVSTANVDLNFIFFATTYLAQ